MSSLPPIQAPPSSQRWLRRLREKLFRPFDTEEVASSPPQRHMNMNHTPLLPCCCFLIFPPSPFVLYPLPLPPPGLHRSPRPSFRFREERGAPGRAQSRSPGNPPRSLGLSRGRRGGVLPPTHRQPNFTSNRLPFKSKISIGIKIADQRRSPTV